MKRKIMILGAGILQLPAIEKAITMGLDVVAVDMNPNAVGFDVFGVQKEVISTIDIPLVLKAAKKHQINGIMTLASDMPVLTAAIVSQELGLVGLPERNALMATNKALMRDALKAANVPIPSYYKVKNRNDFFEAINNIRAAGCKCIVKPADNSGSRGINLLNGHTDLDNAYSYTKRYSRSGEIVVEEYMEGPEVSVETLAVGGEVHVIQITDKETTGAPFFVETGHSQPSRLSEDIKNSIKNVSIAANRAIGIHNGPSHTEIKITKDGPKIVEIGARLGGDCITTHLVPLSTGIDMVENSIKIALGDIPDFSRKWDRGAAIRYMTPPAGIIRRISGIEIIKQLPGLVQVTLTHKEGDCTKTIRSSADRTGFVVTCGVNAEEAIAIAERAIEMVKIEVINDLSKNH